MVSKVASSSHSKGFLHLKWGLFYGNPWRRLPIFFFGSQHLNFCHLVGTAYTYPIFEWMGSFNTFTSIRYLIMFCLLRCILATTWEFSWWSASQLSMSEHYSLLHSIYWLCIVLREECQCILFLSIGSHRLVVGI